jgi:amino acid transporter
MTERAPLSPITLLALGINGIVGVGIFVSPPIVARAFPGALGALVYPAIAIACLPIALGYARLARAFPRDGGPALYAERAFGPRVAFSIGALVWVSALFSTAAVTRALAERLGARVTVIAIALCIGLGLINLRGLRLSAWAWTLLTIAKLTPMFVLAALGAVTAHTQLAAAPTGTRGAALLAVLFALQGFEIVTLPAGQVRDPEKTVPRATIVSILFAGVLYALVHLACVRVLPALGTSTSPIPEAAAALGGSGLSRGIAVGVFASIAGIVVGMHAMTPRYLDAITLGDRPTPTPTRAIVVTAVLAAALCSTSSLAQLLNLSSIAVLVQYATTALSLLVLARRPNTGLRPRDAWTVPFSLAVCVVLLAQAAKRELLVAAAVAALAVLVALVMTRENRE